MIEIKIDLNERRMQLCSESTRANEQKEISGYSIRAHFAR